MQIEFAVVPIGSQSKEFAVGSQQSANRVCSWQSCFSDNCPDTGAVGRVFQFAEEPAKIVPELYESSWPKEKAVGRNWSIADR